MNISTAFKNFIFSKRLQGCSEKTIECYSQVVHPLVEFLGSDAELSTVTRSRYNDIFFFWYRKVTKKSYISTRTVKSRLFLIPYLQKRNGLLHETVRWLHSCSIRDSARMRSALSSLQIYPGNSIL